MNDFSYVTNNEIAVKSYANMISIMEALMQENYVVMVSREENLYIINYVWSPTCDRNNVCFNSRELVEDFIFNPLLEDN